MKVLALMIFFISGCASITEREPGEDNLDPNLHPEMLRRPSDSVWFCTGRSRQTQDCGWVPRQYVEDAFRRVFG
tara:strand:- start:23449 stop:23670 length:222 start_codon:yes stop_codon:yes gene_type:complete